MYKLFTFFNITPILFLIPYFNCAGEGKLFLCSSLTLLFRGKVARR